MTQKPTPQQLPPEEAIELVQTIRTSFEAAWQHYSDGCAALVEAFQRRAWEPLGLPNWDAFVRHTLDVDHVKIPKAERQAIVEALSDGGLSVRQIAAATGLGRSTVQRALGPAVPFGTPSVPVTVTMPTTLEEAVERTGQLADDLIWLEAEIAAAQARIEVLRQHEAKADSQ
jgi:hypothetical protein